MVKFLFLFKRQHYLLELNSNFILRIDSVETQNTVPFSNSLTYFLQHLILLPDILCVKLPWNFSILQIYKTVLQDNPTANLMMDTAGFIWILWPRTTEQNYAKRTYTLTLTGTTVMTFMLYVQESVWEDQWKK